MRAAEQQRLADLQREHREHHGTDCTICFLIKVIAQLKHNANHNRSQEDAASD